MRKERKVHYIRIRREVVEVSREVYIEYYRLRRSAKHLNEDDKANGKILFSTLESGDHLTEDWLASMSDDITNQIEQQITLQQQLSQLKEFDRFLIEQLVLNDRKQVDVAAELGMAQSTISYHKTRILRLLRKNIFENL